MTPLSDAFGAACAVLAFTALALSLNVVRLRRSQGVSLGDGGDRRLEQAIRAHANLVEFVPLTLLLLGVAAARGAPGPWLDGVAWALALARVSHAVGILRHRGPNVGRFVGAGVSFTLLPIAGLLAAWPGGSP